MFEGQQQIDPYNDAYMAPAPPASGGIDARDRDTLPSRGRSRSKSPPRYRSPPSSYRRRSPAAPRPKQAPAQNPQPSNVLGVFGLSIRTRERDLEDEFSRFGNLKKVTIVYDQRSDRSRGFGFITMSTPEEAARCIQELNGIELHQRRIRVDYSVTERAHDPTPGEYMGNRRSAGRDGRRDRGGDFHRDDYRDRDRYDRDRPSHSSRYDDRDRYDRYDRGGRGGDPYGREGGREDWRERRSPPPARGGQGGRYSPERRRRNYSQTPPRGSSPTRSARDYAAAQPVNGERRW